MKNEMETWELPLKAILGETAISVGSLSCLGKGSIIPLNKKAGKPVEIQVSGETVGWAEVVIMDDVYALRVTDMVEGERE